jgi:hypothetical protein
MVLELYVVFYMFLRRLWNLENILQADHGRKKILHIFARQKNIMHEKIAQPPQKI